jgi:RimJ/RimL family protein N-acetyltransferase
MPAHQLPAETETERLVLRQWEAGDVDQLAALQSQPEMMRFFDDGAPYAREQTEAWISWQQGLWTADGYCLWAANLRGGGFVGWIGLTRMFDPVELEGEVEVGWFIDPEFQGHGLATEGALRSLELGFATLGLARIWSRCRRENVASEAVMKKTGMSFVKYLKRPQDPTTEIAIYKTIAPE